MKTVRALLLYAVLAGVLAGLGVGAFSVVENRYLEHGLRFLAFNELTETTNRYLYAVGLATAGCLVAFAALRLCRRRLYLVPLWALALAGVAVMARRLELDFILGFPWKEIDTTLKVVLLAWILVCFDLIAGRRWLLGRGDGPGLRLGLLLLTVPIGLNVAESLWRDGLQERLAGRPDFFIFVVDALRADHVGCYGYERDTTPTIDSLAAEGVIFTDAVSNSNKTRLTVPSIFTLLFPSVTRLDAFDTALASRTFTVAELLKNEGYETLCYIPNPSMKKYMNFDQGFDVYDDKIFGRRHFRGYESQSVISRRLLGWLKKNRGKPYFLYMHNADVHAPYTPPEPYASMYYDPDAPVKTITEADYARMHGYQRHPDDNNDVNFYMARYDGEIRYTDDKFRELLGEMRGLGALDNAAIFVTADHGEGFLEHGEWDHGRTVYDELVHVPLIAALPGAEGAGRRSDRPVHTFDISATILDLAGVSPVEEMQAKSFMPLLRGRDEQLWEYSFVEAHDARALRSADWKFMRILETGEERLYDLRKDPGETTDVLPEVPELADELRLKLAALEKANALLSEGGFAESTELDDETIEQLRSLGYID